VGSTRRARRGPGRSGLSRVGSHRDAIEGLEAAAQLPGKLFHAGTRREQDRIVTSGGRVLCAVGLGNSVRDAQREAYALIEPIEFRGMQWRRDIGYRAIERERGCGPDLD